LLVLFLIFSNVCKTNICFTISLHFQILASAISVAQFPDITNNLLRLGLLSIFGLRTMRSCWGAAACVGSSSVFVLCAAAGVLRPAWGPLGLFILFPPSCKNDACNLIICSIICSLCCSTHCCLLGAILLNMRSSCFCHGAHICNVCYIAVATALSKQLRYLGDTLIYSGLDRFAAISKQPHNANCGINEYIAVWTASLQSPSNRTMQIAVSTNI
jgi:hypothetical protein